jgi:ABC-type branched-subunit amino acid transport system substrate-binding protein
MPKLSTPMTSLHDATTVRPVGVSIVALSTAVIGALCLASTACVSTNQPSAPPEAIHVGTVLPFSGSRASSGVPLESALRLAIDQVNQVGLGGRPLWLDVADSHSDDVRGSANALELINSVPMPFFVGTEEPKIAYQITTAVKANHMVHLMPGLTSAQFHDPSATAAWFRLSPSVTFVSCALAKHMLGQGIKKASLLLDPDDYSGNFAANFGHVFSSKGGILLPTMQIGSTAYADLLTTLARLSPDATVLVTSPAAAAGFLQEWAVRGKPIKLYLGPTLNNPELLRNVPVGVLEGMSGVSADLGTQSADFDAFFEARTGVPPIAGSHYYYDAVAMLSLAAGRGLGLTGTLPAPATMKEHMLSVTSTGGTVITYDRLAEGLGLLGQGQKIQYVGAAGLYVLNALGDSTLNRGVIWSIKGNEFQTIDYQQCDVSELQNGGT